MASLHFESTYDGSKLRDGLKMSNKEVSEWARNAAHSGETVENMFNRVQKVAAGYLTLQFSASMITQIASVRGEWQKYEAVLTNTLGSNKDAVESLKMISEYGAKTNFQVNELTDSFVKLAGQGFKPTREELAKLGDLAASKAKGFNQLTEAIIDAETFEFERLKEFGIRASKDGEKITFTFKGIKTTVDASAASVRDYVLSLGELEGVKGSTEAISKTIVGLASNFQDALDQMFNSMGKSQEGLIAGSIKAGTELVQNYEKVIDVMKVLVATYGAYKAVTIATMAIQASARFAENIQLISMFRKEMGLATAAQQAFNISAKANPYGIILALVTGLISALVIFSKGTKTAEDMVNDLNDSIAQIGKQQEINGLIEKYDELKNKTKLTDDEQKELNSTIQQLATIFPTAVGQVDEYGKAIDLVADRLRTANKEYQAFLKTATQQEVDNTTKKLQGLIAMREHLLQGVNSGQRTMTTQRMGEAPKEVTVVLSEKEKQKETERIKELSKEIDSLSSTLTEAQKKLLGLSSVTTEQALKPYQDLFKKVSEYTTKQAYDTKAKLTELLGAGLGSEAEEKIKQQIDSIAESLNLPTVKEQIAQITKAIADAEVKLTEMRGPTSLSSAKEITEQEKNIKDQKDQLAALTGVKQKEIDKELKSEEDRLKKQAELNQKEIDLMLARNKAVISVMGEGIEKQKALAKLAYDEDLARIKKEEQDRLKDINEAKGLKATDKGYITVLPEGEQQAFNDQKIAAEWDYTKQVEKINVDAAKAQKQIWDEATEAFLSDIEKENRAVNDKYDNLVNKALEAGSTQEEIDALNKNRADELTQVQSNSALKLSSFYKKAFGDISRYGFKTLDSLKDKIDDMIKTASQVDVGGKTMIQVQFPTDQVDEYGNTVKKTVTMSIEEFEKFQNKVDDISEEQENRNPFRALKDSFNDLQKAIDSGDKKAISDAMEVFLSNTEKSIAAVKTLADAIGGDLGSTITTITQLADGIVSIAKGIATENPADIIAGAAGIFQAIYNSASAYKRAQEQWTRDLIELQLEYNSVLNEQLRIQEQQTVFVTDYAKSIRDASTALNDAQKSYNGLLDGKSIDEFLSELDVKIGVKSKGSNWAWAGGIVSGILGGKKKKDVFGDLLETYDELINKDGTLNVQLAETLLNTDALWTSANQGSKDALTALVEYQNQINEANEQIKEAVSSLAGAIGDDLFTAISDAWDNGTDSFEAFKGTVMDGLKDIIKQMTFNEIFSDSLEQLEEGLAASFVVGGDQNPLDEFTTFLNSAPGLLDAWESAMKGWDQAAKAAGIDWTSTDTSTASGLTRSAQSLTEETGGELAGIWRKTSDDTRQIRDYTKEGINHLVRIEANTYNTVVELQNAVNELKGSNTRLEQIVTNTKPQVTGRDTGE